MASSSVSQDDIDNDFEKNSRRSRIRTARARQINPALPGPPPSSVGGGGADRLDAIPHEDECAGDAMDGHDENLDTSPKPVLRGKEVVSNVAKRANLKMHHVNKGKQQRDRRKLREKRRSTGVVHLASTESTTGGSTTGDDDESSDQREVAGAAAALAQGQTQAGHHHLHLSAETKRNTALNESLHSNPDDLDKCSSSVVSSRPNVSGSSPSSSLFPPPPSILRSVRRAGGNKSASDLEADDENDHDSLNQSESSSTFSSSNHIPGLASSNEHLNRIGASNGASGGRIGALNAAATSSAPSTSRHRAISPGRHHHHHQSVQIERILEENKRLLSIMEEKDKKIDLLEIKIQQMMKETTTKSEEQLRLQKENTTLLRALSNITKK